MHVAAMIWCRNISFGMLALASPLVSPGSASLVHAAEVECPLVHPRDGAVRFWGGEPLLGDARIGSTPDTIERRGDRHLDTIDYSDWEIRTGNLLCAYENGSELIVPISGLMGKCHWLERDVLRPKPVEPNTGGPITSVTLRFWCTSRP